MRQYEPIWITLKTHGRAVISAPKNKHRHIVRMVCKEKWQDKAFNQKEVWRMKYITYRIHEDEITFTLDYCLSHIVRGDL